MASSRTGHAAHMAGVLGAAFVLVLSATAGAIAWRRQRRMMGDDFRRAWKALPRARKREVARAVRRGQAVRDPRDAELAIEFANYLERTQQRGRWRSRWWRLDVVLVGIGAVASVVFAIAWHRPAELLRIWPAALLGLAILFRRKLRSRISRAREANAELKRDVG